jgi:hypothetical protein
VTAVGLLVTGTVACAEQEPAGIPLGTTTSEATTTTTSPGYPPSPTSIEEAWIAMDGLFAPSVLQAPTVGLDPFSIKDDPTPLYDDIDTERLESELRQLAEPRGADDPEGLLAAAALVEDGFRDAGYAVTRLPDGDGGEAAEGEATTTTGATGEDEPGSDDPPALLVEIPGETCPVRSVLLVAPYDAPAGSPGARAASATVALLEVARILAERPLPMTVQLLAVPFGSDDPTSGRMDDVVEGLELDPVAVLALEGLGVAAPEADADNMVGLPPAYLVLAGDDGSEYLARVTSLAGARFMPQFWAMAAVADPTVFPEFDDQLTSSWWSDDVPALLVTDTHTRADERVGTDEDEPAIVDIDFLSNGIRSLLTTLVGVGTIDNDLDGEPDVCQRTW